jgi:hydroxycarboxylate dehydrogenase B
MPAFRPDSLRLFAQKIFEACGTPAADAAIVADHLVSSNLCGVDSHGVIRIPQYVHEIREGSIVPGAPLQILQETETTAVVDGAWNFGPVVAHRAMEIALEKALRHRTAFVVTHRCGHAGRLGTYAELAAEKGCFSFAVCNSPIHGHFVLPWGGREPRLATNPLAYGFPSNLGHPVVADFSTAATPEGKLRVYRDQNKPLPPDWIVDHEGRPSTNPQEFYGPPRGAILPFGGRAGYRSYALALLVEILGGTLAGQHITVDQPGNGVAFMVLDISAFMPREQFLQSLREVRDYMKSSRPAAGFDEVMLPGEPEFLRKKEHEESGIVLAGATWAEILKAAESLGVEGPPATKG